MEKNLGRMLAAFFAAAETTKRMVRDIEVKYHFNHEYHLAEVYFGLRGVETEVNFSLNTETWNFEAPHIMEGSQFKDIVAEDAAQLVVAMGSFLHKVSETVLDSTLELAYERYNDCVKNYYKLGT